MNLHENSDQNEKDSFEKTCRISHVGKNSRFISERQEEKNDKFQEIFIQIRILKLIK